MSTRPDIKNSHIFNAAGPGTGVWSGGGVTKTKPSRTLFITAIPEATDMRTVETLFSVLQGYVGFRTVRRMAFVDFENERHATAGMRKYQGHILAGSKFGLLIDYDKDEVSKRNKSYEKELAFVKQREEDANSLRYFCSCCKTRCVVLDKMKALELMPQRTTDGSFCVNEEKYLRSVNMVKADVKLVKREKGIETQYPLNCTLCDVMVAYRSAPIGDPTKFLYVLSGALTSDPRPHGHSSNIVGGFSRAYHAFDASTGANMSKLGTNTLQCSLGGAVAGGGPVLMGHFLNPAAFASAAGAAAGGGHTDVTEFDEDDPSLDFSAGFDTLCAGGGDAAAIAATVVEDNSLGSFIAAAASTPAGTSTGDALGADAGSMVGGTHRLDGGGACGAAASTAASEPSPAASASSGAGAGAGAGVDASAVASSDTGLQARALGSLRACVAASASSARDTVAAASNERDAGVDAECEPSDPKRARKRFFSEQPAKRVFSDSLDSSLQPPTLQ